MTFCHIPTILPWTISQVHRSHLKSCFVNIWRVDKFVPYNNSIQFIHFMLTYLKSFSMYEDRSLWSSGRLPDVNNEWSYANPFTLQTWFFKVIAATLPVPKLDIIYLSWASWPLGLFSIYKTIIFTKSFVPYQPFDVDLFLKVTAAILIMNVYEH